MRVEFYGVLAEVAGDEHTELAISEHQSVQSILDRLQSRFPALERHLPRVACAVGDDLVLRDDAVDDDTTLVLLPPVSGG